MVPRTPKSLPAFLTSASCPHQKHKTSVVSAHNINPFNDCWQECGQCHSMSIPYAPWQSGSSPAEAQEGGLQALQCHQPSCSLSVFLENSGVSHVPTFHLPRVSPSTPHTLAQLQTLPAPRQKLPPGPRQACGIHCLSGNNLQDPSGFSPKKLPEQEAGSWSLSWAHRKDLHLSTSGPSQAAASQTFRDPHQSPVSWDSSKLSLDLGEVRGRAEDHLEMPREVDVNREHFTSVQWWILDP